MRSILQLVGGVAVAGVVAAGSTAFTAGSGLSTSVTSAVVGGALAAPISVSGANIATLGFVHAADPNSSETTKMYMTLQKDDNTTAITTGTLTVAMTATAGTAAPTCSYISGATRWECDATVNWTGITAVAVKYAEA